MLQSPSAPLIVKYHNLSLAPLKSVALREYKKIQSGRIPSALYSGKCTKRLEEVARCGHFSSLTIMRVNIWCSLVLVQDIAPLPLGISVDPCSSLV